MAKVITLYFLVAVRKVYNCKFVTPLCATALITQIAITTHSEAATNVNLPPITVVTEQFPPYNYKERGKRGYWRRH
jgi:hypothetical protein